MFMNMFVIFLLEIAAALYDSSKLKVFLHHWTTPVQNVLVLSDYKVCVLNWYEIVRHDLP